MSLFSSASARSVLVHAMGSRLVTTPPPPVYQPSLPAGISPNCTCDCSRSTEGRERNNLVQYAWFTGRLPASGQISISVHIYSCLKYINISSTPCYLPAICHCASMRGANADPDANTWITSEPIEQIVIICDEYLCCY